MRRSDDSGLDRGEERAGALARAWAMEHKMDDWHKVVNVRRSKSIGCVIATQGDGFTQCWTCGDVSMPLGDDD